jgi:thioredoxin
MKKRVLLILIVSSILFINCSSGNSGEQKDPISKESSVKQLTNESFKKLVFNYEAGEVWKYEGDKPAIIDFYADWCAPCRQLSPLVESVADEYSGKIVVYKVDTEKEKLLAQSLGISGLPTLLFIPAEGTPRASMGLISREDMLKAITDVLQIK